MKTKMKQIMKTSLLLLVGLVAWSASAAETPPTPSSQPAATGARQVNSLTEDEKKAGWRLLFDSKTTEGWRGYKMDKMPPGWKVIDGTLVRVSGGAGGKGAGGGDDIITVEQFDSFVGHVFGQK